MYYVYTSLKVSSYSALFAVRCGALTRVTLKFELEYDNTPHRTANNVEYELTFNGLICNAHVCLIALECLHRRIAFNQRCDTPLER